MSIAIVSKGEFYEYDSTLLIGRDTDNPKCSCDRRLQVRHDQVSLQVSLACSSNRSLLCHELFQFSEKHFFKAPHQLCSCGSFCRR